MTIAVVLQPGYLPWLGFFDQVRRADFFIYLDDVQFDKNGWRNRNRVKAPGGPVWLTVPVRAGGSPRLDAIAIDSHQPWARKHVATLTQLYARAPFARRYLPELSDLLLGQTWDNLLELDLAVTARLLAWLGLERRILRASDLRVEGERSERLLNFCRRVGADHYLSGAAARSYLDVPLFEAAGITVEWQDYAHPVYPQMHGPFVPFLSTIDLILNCGDDSLAIIAAGGPPSR